MFRQTPIAKYRKENFKKTTDDDTARKRREAEANSKSRKRRMDVLEKRRGTFRMDVQMTDVTPMVVPPMVAPPMDTPLAATIHAHLVQIQARGPDALKSLEAIRTILSTEDAPSGLFIALKGHEVLMSAIKVENAPPQVPVIVMRTFSNLTAGSRQEVKVLIDDNLVPIVVAGLDHADPVVRFNAAWTAGNIAADNVSWRDMMVSYNVVPEMFKSVKYLIDTEGIDEERRTEMLDTFLWSLSYHMRSKHVNSLQYIPECMQLIARFGANCDILDHLTKMLGHMSNLDGFVGPFRQNGVDEMALHYLNNNSTLPVYVSCLTIISSIISSTEDWVNDYVDELIQKGMMNRFTEMLNRTENIVLSNACFALSNLATGPEHHVQVIIDAGLLPRLLEIFTTQPMATREEVAFVLLHIARGTRAQVKVLCEHGVHHTLAQNLTRYKTEYGFIHLILGTLQEMLKVQPSIAEDIDVQCFEAISNFQYSENIDVARKAASIMSGADADADADMF